MAREMWAKTSSHSGCRTIRSKKGISKICQNAYCVDGNLEVCSVILKTVILGV